MHSWGNSNHLVDPTSGKLCLQGQGDHTAPRPAGCQAGRCHPRGGTAATCRLGAICQRGREEGACRFRERGDFLPLFLSCRTQQIKPPRTANHQLILAQIPKGPALLQGRFLHRLLVAKAAAPRSPVLPRQTAEPVLENIRPLPSQVTGWVRASRGQNRGREKEDRTNQRAARGESGRNNTAATGTGHGRASECRAGCQGANVREHGSGGAVLSPRELRLFVPLQ